MTKVKSSVSGIIIEVCVGYIVGAQIKQEKALQKGEVWKDIQGKSQETGMQTRKQWEQSNGDKKQQDSQGNCASSAQLASMVEAMGEEEESAERSGWSGTPEEGFIHKPTATDCAHIPMRFCVIEAILKMKPCISLPGWVTPQDHLGFSNHDASRA